MAAEWDSYVVLWRSITVSAASMEREMRECVHVAWSYNAYKAGERALVDEVVRQQKYVAVTLVLQGLM